MESEALAATIAQLKGDEVVSEAVRQTFGAPPPLLPPMPSLPKGLV